MPLVPEPAKTYIVLRSFHLGEITLSLSAGAQLLFDGNTLVYRGKQYNCPSLSRAILAKLVVEDDGTYEVSTPQPVERPRPNIVVQNQQDLIVAKVRLPEHEGITAAKVVRTSEDVARSVGTPANRKVIVADQQVVGTAGMPKAAKAPVAPQAQPDRAALAAQGGTVVTKVKDRAQALLEQEGVVLKSGTRVIADASDGTVVGRVKSNEQREADSAAAQRAKSASARVAMLSSPEERTPEEDAEFKENLARALAKRAGSRPQPPPPPTLVDPKAPAKPTSIARPAAKTIKVAEVVEAEEAEMAAAEAADAKESLPADYPQFNRFTDRINWIAAKIELGPEGVEIAKLIYRLSNEKFRAHMAASFETIDFE